MSFFHKRPYIFFILPALLLYAVFIIYPMVAVVPCSFTEWSGTGPAKFVGFQNFITIFGNSDIVAQFLNAIKNTFFLLLLHYLITLPVAIGVAYLLFKKIAGSSMFTTIIFMPQFVNAVATIFIVTLFFSPDIGLYTTVMNALGLSKYSVPGIWENPSLAIPLVVLVGAWRGIGYDILLFIASFRTVPVELEEAAKIDGAGAIRRFFHIYFPLISPTFNNMVVLVYIWTLTAFETPFLLGGNIGGVNGCMDTIQLFFYRTVFGTTNYVGNFMGIGSALSLVIMAVLILGSLFLQRILSKREYFAN